MSRQNRADASWRDRLSNVTISGPLAASSAREYVYTHGYEPPTGAWAVPIDWVPDRLELVGEIRWVEYISRKKFEGPRTFIFNHKFLGANKPWLARGVNRYGETAYAVLGGGYTVTAHGIEDDASDRRRPPSAGDRVRADLPRGVVGMGTMYGFGVGSRHIDLSGKGLVLAYTRGRRAQLYVVPDRQP